MWKRNREQLWTHAPGSPSQHSSQPQHHLCWLYQMGTAHSAFVPLLLLPPCPSSSSSIHFITTGSSEWQQYTSHTPHILPMTSEMNDSQWLRIWQQNLNTSHMAQLSLLNNVNCSNYEILVIQEPYINSLRNMISNHHHHVLYPSQCFTSTWRCRAVMLVTFGLGRDKCRLKGSAKSSVSLLDESRSS